MASLVTTTVTGDITIYQAGSTKRVYVKNTDASYIGSFFADANAVKITAEGNYPLLLHTPGTLTLNSGGSAALTLDGSQGATFGGDLYLAVNENIHWGGNYSFITGSGANNTGYLKFYTSDTLRLTIAGDGAATFSGNISGGGTAIFSAKMTAGLGHFENSSHTIVDIKSPSSGNMYSMLRMTSNGTQDNYIRADVGNLVIDGSHTSVNITKALAVTGALTGTSATFKLDAGLTLERTSVDSRLRMFNTGGEWIIASTYGSTGAYDPIKFQTSDTTRLTIAANGAATFTGAVATGAITCSTIQTSSTITSGAGLSATTGSFSGNLTGGGTAIFTGDMTIADDFYFKATNAWIIAGSVAGGALTGGTLRIQNFGELEVDGVLDVNGTGASIFTDSVSTPALWFRASSTAVHCWQPKDGWYHAGGNVHTGAIRIKMPPFHDAMVTFWVDVYDYAANESFSAYISCYPYISGTPTYSHTSAVIIGGVARNFTVRFGDNNSASNTEYYVYIGETNSTWNHPQVVVRDVFAGYHVTSGEWEGGDAGWGVSFATSFENVAQTQSNTLPYGDYNKLLNTPTLSFLPLTGGTLTGTLTSRTIAPSADSTYDLGENTARYANLFVDSITGTGASTFGGNITTNGSQFYFYRAVNSGNPEFHIGSAAAERLTIQSVYASGAQTLASVSFRTFSSLGSANAGQMNFYVDNSSTEILKIQDTGISALALTATSSITLTSGSALNASALTTTTCKLIGVKLSYTGGSNTANDIIGGISMGNSGEEYAGMYAIDGGSGARTQLALFSGSNTYGIRVGMVIEGLYGHITAPGGYISTGTSSQPLNLGDDSRVLSIAYGNEIWSNNDDNSAQTLHINHRGYAGALTQFRSLKVRNGKGADIAFFDGTNKATTLSGALSVTANAYSCFSGGNLAIGSTDGYAGQSSGVLHLQNNTSGGVISMERQDSSLTGQMGLIVFGTRNYDDALCQIRATCDSTATTPAGSGGYLSFDTEESGGNLTERMRIQADGNVGIGTTAPAGLLHLSHASFDYPLVIESSNAGFHSLLKTVTNVTAVFGSVRNGADGNFGANTAIAGTTSNHAFDIFTNNTKRLTISAAGASTFIGDLDVTSALTVGDFKLTSNVLSADTADGSDNKELYICAGGAQNANRGAYIDMTGNDYPTWGGLISMVCGEGGNAGFNVLTGGVNRLAITSAGAATFSGAVATGAITCSTIQTSGVATLNSNAIVGGDLDVAQYIRHTGDTNTQIRFESSQITIGTSGGCQMSFNGDEKLYFYTGTSSTLALTLDTSQNATFGGTLTIKDGSYSGPDGEAGYRLKFKDHGGVHNDCGIGVSGSSAAERMWFNALNGFEWNIGTYGVKLTLTSAGLLTTAGGVTVGGDIQMTTAATSSKIRFGTSSWGNNIGLESYWSVHQTNRNEGWLFRDTDNVELLRIFGSNNGTTPRQATFGGVLAATGLDLGDNQKARFGASDDLEIYHDGSNSYITDAGTGSLKLGASHFHFMNAAHSEYMMTGTSNEGIALYYNNAVKLTTVTGGVTVTGTLTAGVINADQLDNSSNTKNIIYRGASSDTIVGGGTVPAKLYVYDTGNVGIGTTTNNQKLIVKGAANQNGIITADVTTTGYTTALLLRNAGNDKWLINNDGGNSHAFEIYNYTAAENAITITASTSTVTISNGSLLPGSTNAQSLGNTGKRWNFYANTGDFGGSIYARYGIKDDNGSYGSSGQVLTSGGTGVVTWQAGGGSGTVTSVATTGAITGGTITTSGTIAHSTSAGYKHIPSGGSSGQFLKYSSSGTAVWAGGVLNTDFYVHVGMRTTAASGTDGGTLTSNTWTTRDLNHTYTNNGSFATVSTSNNTVTLNAGTYYVRFWATGYGVQEHQAQLYNSTDSYVFLSGSNQRPSSSIENSNSIGSGIVSFGGPGAKAFLIRQIVDYTRATYGGGRHLNYDDISSGNFEYNTYWGLEIWKVG